jgi:tetratricopeptide (TPR) repeat protein
VTLDALGRSDEAIALYDNVIARFGAAPEPALRELVAKTLFNKGVTLGGLGRSDEEIAAYDDLLGRFGAASEPALREQVAKALVNKGVRLGALGIAELANNRFKEACRLFRRALQCNPARAEVTKEAIEYYILKYYGLGPEEEEHPSNGYDLPIRKTQLRQLLRNYSDHLVANLSHPEDPPFPILPPREVEAAIAHGKKHPWNKREKDGWPLHADIFKYIFITYARWIPGLTSAIISRADKSAYDYMQVRKTRAGTPDWFDVPSAAEARELSETDPRRLAHREIQRERKRRERALQKNASP